MADRWRAAAAAGAVLAAGAALWIGSREPLPGTPPPGARERPGFAIFTRACARCHGQDGVSDRASRMAREPVSLVDPVWKTGIARAKIAEIVRHGTGKMEGLGDKLSDAEIDAVAGYVVWLPAPHDTRAAR